VVPLVSMPSPYCVFFFFVDAREKKKKKKKKKKGPDPLPFRSCGNRGERRGKGAPEARSKTNANKDHGEQWFLVRLVGGGEEEGEGKEGPSVCSSSFSVEEGEGFRCRLTCVGNSRSVPEERKESATCTGTVVPRGKNGKKKGYWWNGF